MQNLNRIDLPLYEGKAYVHPKDETWYNTPEEWKIWVQYYTWYKERTQIGWIMDEAKRKAYWAEREADNIRKLGHYEFRRTPVPGVGHKRTHIRAKTHSGFRKEQAANDNCPKQLVRKKRAYVVLQANCWGENLRMHYRENHNRGWKRSKKQKQWM